MAWGETVISSTPKKKMLLMWVLRNVGLAETVSGSAGDIADSGSSRKRRRGKQGNENHPGLFPGAED